MWHCSRHRATGPWVIFHASQSLPASCHAFSVVTALPPWPLTLATASRTTLSGGLPKSTFLRHRFVPTSLYLEGYGFGLAAANSACFCQYASTYTSRARRFSKVAVPCHNRYPSSSLALCLCIARAAFWKRCLANRLYNSVTLMSNSCCCCSKPRLASKRVRRRCRPRTTLRDMSCHNAKICAHRLAPIVYWTVKRASSSIPFSVQIIWLKDVSYCVQRKMQLEY